MKQKVALVCDWLTNVGGAEKVLLEFHWLYPEAPIYTSQYNAKGINWFKDAEVRTGWMQIIPAGMRRLVGPLRQWYFSHLDLSEYDLIISVTGAEAKAVKSGSWLHKHGKKDVKNPKGIHISYCHVPTQYYWQMYEGYIKDPGFGILNPIVRFGFKLLVKPLRNADFKAAVRPDFYITISEYAKEQIAKYYKREATVINPPVDIKAFSLSSSKDASDSSEITAEVDDSRSVTGGESDSSLKCVSHVKLSDYYIVTSRQVNWKRIDLAIKACLKLKRKLIVIGEGPEHKELARMAAKSNLIEFLPKMEKEELAKYLAGARGYLFPSLEPFGIAPVEALAVGCPVIAYNKGGARDYIRDKENGVLFEKQTVDSLAEAIERFEKMKFDREKIIKSAERFSTQRFDKEIENYVNERLK